MDWMDVKETDARKPDAAAERPARANDSIPGLLDGLNPPQLEAATHVDGPLLILAGPGSGKTRVITRRIAWLVSEGHAQAWEILAITFTNKAAREMRERVERILPIQGMWISTFHSMCARILRRDIGLLGSFTRDFSIYDTSDRNQLLRKLTQNGGWDTTRFKPAMVGAWISALKNKGVAEIANESMPLEGDGIEHEVLAQIAHSYGEALHKANALDFDDLLLKVLELFEQHPGARDAYASRFRQVMVDEYQDTNRVQYQLTRHLSGWHKNLTVCGDPDQSIYAWRGADLRNILDFEQDFGARKVVKLEQNYRSTGHILAAAQAVIANNRARKEKRTWSAAEEGRKPCVIECGDENDEAAEIVNQIRGLRADGLELSEIAIFYRVNFMQRALETALRRASVPYQIIGGTQFYDRREIRDLLAYLKLIVNRSDDIAFARAVNVPARGVGQKSLEMLANWAADRRVPLADAVRSREALALVRGRARAGLEQFGLLLDRIAPLCDQPAAFAIDHLLAEIDVKAWLAEMDDESGVDREANLDELRAHAEQFDREPIAAVEDTTASSDPFGSESPVRGLRGFLQEVALVSDTDDLDDRGGKVALMTLHSAKGLEYPAVFIAGVEEELLPHARALIEAEGEDLEGAIEEERRLFYVGLTRAMKRLTLTWARTRMYFGESSFRSPSRFLEEIPPERLEGGESDASEDQMLGAFEKPPSAPELALGDKVEHEHFGRGVVERLQGSGANARATVRFVTHGEKQLLLAYAKLKLVRSAQR